MAAGNASRERARLETFGLIRSRNTQQDLTGLSAMTPTDQTPVPPVPLRVLSGPLTTSGGGEHDGEVPRTRWQRIRAWRPNVQEWLLLVPAMVWTLALLGLFVAPPVVGVVGIAVGIATSTLLGVLCARYTEAQHRRESELRVLQDMVGVAYARIDYLESKVHPIAQ